MKYLIKIDRRSIKENHNAGQTSLHEYISTDCTVTIYGPHEAIPQSDGILISAKANISNWGIERESVYFINSKKPEELDSFLKTLLKKYPKKVGYTINNNYNEINFLTPEPPFLFKYLKTKVKCKYCNASFSYTKLRDEDDYDYEETYYGRSNICPQCDKEDCCAIEFESISSIVLEKARLPRLVVG